MALNFSREKNYLVMLSAASASTTVFRYFNF